MKNKQSLRANALKKDFLSITDLDAKEIWQVLVMAKKLRSDKGQVTSDKENILADKNVVLLFEKPSLRTKLSFDVGISQLGGHPIYFGANIEDKK